MTLRVIGDAFSDWNTYTTLSRLGNSILTGTNSLNRMGLWKYGLQNWKIVEADMMNSKNFPKHVISILKGGNGHEEK